MAMRPLIYIFALVLLGGGCMSTPKNPIPRRGEVVAQGAGQLSFRAPAAGLVSVYDVNTDSVILSTAVVRGSVVLVNPQAGNVTVTDADRSGTEIVNTGINKSNRYEMWFIPVTGGTYTATSPSQSPPPSPSQQQQP
jgi:hypothetical protein